ncbi:GAF and ANTAR domain-containing protein [Nocardioides sp. Leaf374]|uniref:GAF and ANTAR domain-containing protein n=1 Tax=Nocardioides sp. Leaf374 TaxID=2876560 RepID=UPI001E411673|nr:GAF and ANTAR domain-containing protein [Nocardioides sp. Leaf374]
MSREQLLATTFVELADTLGDDFDVVDFLQNLAERSAEILGADAAAIVLADQRGALRVIATTTHAARDLGLETLATAEGPCLDAFRSGDDVVNVPRTEGLRRWPRFVRTTEELGYPSVHAVPLRLRSERLGALALLYAAATDLTDDDRAIARALTAVATVGLLQERTPRQREVLADQLQAALSLRVVVEQAKGVVAEWADLEIEEAFALMRAFAREHARPLGTVATDVIEGRLAVGDLLPPERPTT